MWLLGYRVKQIIEQVEARGFTPSSEQLAEFTAARAFDAGSGSAPRILSIADDKAEISIEGVLTKAPDFMATLFGGGNTTYTEIISAIAIVEQDPAIKETLLRVDSPGGHFEGLFDLLGAISAAKKPIRTVVTGAAESAAFAIAALTHPIEAVNSAVLIGSVGVAFTACVADNEVTITSTDAPKKRPDLMTEAGRAVIQKEMLDPMHSLFAESIAGGRGVTVETVNAEFGQGITLLAGEALKRGMIDSISAPTATTPPAPAASASAKPVLQSPIKIDKQDKTEVTVMDLVTLQKEHGTVFAEAVQVGVSQERDRVSAHLTLGAGSDVAMKAIKEGVPMTEALRAEYTVALVSKSAIDARGAEDTGLGALGASPDAPTDADSVADAVCAGLGMDDEGSE